VQVVAGDEAFLVGDFFDAADLVAGTFLYDFYEWLAPFMLSNMPGPQVLHRNYNPLVLINKTL